MRGQHGSNKAPKRNNVIREEAKIVGGKGNVLLKGKKGWGGKGGRLKGVHQGKESEYSGAGDDSIKSRKCFPWKDRG